VNKPNDKKRVNWFPLVIFLLFFGPEYVVPLAVCGGLGWVIFRNVKKRQGSTPKFSGKTATRYTTRKESFDECPQPFFCRHKDKAEHHVRRGKEIDPWDRPDIDISKYQRKR